MADSTAGAGNTSTNTDYGAAQGNVDDEIDQMNKAFAFATKANMEITTAKTVDGAEETAAQQRPNIG